MECRTDIITIGSEILGRTLTNDEVNELDNAMHSRYDMYCEDYDDDVDVDALFSEDFYDNLKENMEEMGLITDED